MADVGGADVRFERQKLDRQKKQVAVGLTDSRLQLAKAKREMETNLRYIEESKALVPEILANSDDDEVAQLEQQLAREKAELNVMNFELRVTELEGIIERLTLNVTASTQALADIESELADKG